MNTEATQKQAQTEFFGTEPVFRILFRLAPPIMCAQLVSALYNIIDSFFVGKLADSGLTALSVIFPLQLLINALGAGTGIGVNTVMAKRYGEQQPEEAQAAAGTGTLLAVCSWLGLVILMLLFFPAYVSGSTSSDIVRKESLEYGWIVCLGSLPQLMDHVWIKIHQAEGNMRLPMMAQILGSAVNILLDPLLIFGMPGFPALGIRDAAIATVAGQIAAALVTGMHGFRRIPTAGQIGRNALLIYQMGVPAIVMQGFYSVYITGLNLVLISFSETAVTVLGLYYKLQTFFFGNRIFDRRCRVFSVLLAPGICKANRIITSEAQTDAALRLDDFLWNLARPRISGHFTPMHVPRQHHHPPACLNIKNQLKLMKQSADHRPAAIFLGRNPGIILILTADNL